MKKINLKEIQNNYYSATLENIKYANDAITKGQNWLLTFGLAELAFLGTILSLDVDINKTLCFSLSAKSLIIFCFVLLFINFIGFFIGIKYQHSHLLRNARKYYELVLRVSEFKNKFHDELDEMPDFLSDKDIRDIKSNNIANITLLISIICIFISTIIILLIIPQIF